MIAVGDDEPELESGNVVGGFEFEDDEPDPLVSETCATHWLLF